MTQFEIKSHFLDMFSISEQVLFYFAVITSIVYQNTFSIFLFIAYILKPLLIYYPKKFAKKFPIGKRPKGAFNCNTFNCGGKPKTGGIFSGHMVTITMTAVLIILSLKDINEMTTKKWIGFLFILFSTGISRVYKKCHTIFQVLLGVSLGIVFGFILYSIQNKLSNFERFENDRKEILYLFL